MSRFYYDDYSDDARQYQWYFESNLKRALTTRRSARALADLVSALDALPKHELMAGRMIERWYEDDDETLRAYEVCAIGAYALYKGADVKTLPECSPEYSDDVVEETAAIGAQYGMAKVLAQHISWLNDERFEHLAPRARWQAVRDWAVKQLGEYAL